MQTTHANSSAVKYYDAQGKPVFKKKIPEINILVKRSRGDKILFTTMFIVLLAHCITLAFPLGWMFVSSFKEASEYVMGNPFSLPEVWEVENYFEAITMLDSGGTNFLGMLFNSIWYTAICTGLGVFMPSVTGYVMSKYKFKARNLMYAIAIGSMMLPIIGTSAASMRFFAEIGVYDTPLYPIVVNLGGFGGSFLIYYGYFKSISWSYAEAARIDGAGHFTIFFRIMLPQAVPLLMTYAITGAIGHWNDYSTMIMFMPHYPTLASGLFEYQAIAVRKVDYPRYYAGLMIAMVPTIALFAAFSQKIMTSISIGGLKG